MDSRAARARRLLEVARPCPAQAPACRNCRHPPTVPAPPQPANADGTRRSAQGSPKHASKPEGEHRSDASTTLKLELASKSENPSELDSKPDVLVEDQSKRGSLKRKSKPEVRFEAFQIVAVSFTGPSFGG